MKLHGIIAEKVIKKSFEKPKYYVGSQFKRRRRFIYLKLWKNACKKTL